MARITQARAFANNEVALVAWQIDEPIPDCRGFEITRIYASGEERVLPVHFFLDRALPVNIDRVTLSYTFYDTPARVAAR